MTRKKVKFAWIENPNARATSMRKRRLGLVKKVREITILCDVKGCIIIFSPNDDEPMVWPSIEATRELLDHFFALPEVEKVKRETSLESYMKQKTAKMQEEVAKLQKKNKEYGIDLLMDQMNRDRETANLTLSEIYTMLSYLKEKIILCRKKLGPALFPPLRSPPRVPLGLQFEEGIRTRTNDFPVGGHESARNDEQARERLNIGTAIMGNQGQYVIDQWVPINSEPENNQQIGMNQVCYNECPNFRSYLPYQGSSSNGNPNLEMEPVFPQLMMTFYDLGGSVSRPFQHLGMNSNPLEAMSQQPMQYTFNPMSDHEYGVNEEGYNINNCGSEFYGSNNNNTIAFNSATGQEPPPNGTTAAGDSNVDLKPFDINKPPGF